MSRRTGNSDPSVLTRAVESVFAFVKFAECDILFFLFFVIAYVIFEDIYLIASTAWPEYNQILVKKPGGFDFWPY